MTKNTSINNSKPRKKIIGSEAFWCYVMIALPLIGFFAFKVFPILWTFKWSFFSYTGVESQARFIGFDNFKTMFSVDFTYWKAWLTTFQIAAIKLPVEVSFAMILALLLNNKMKGAGVYQAFYYLPHIISTAIVGLILSNMFNYNGVINALLEDAGLINESIDWFSTKSKAMVAIISGSVWMHFGVNVMYILAALSNVPEELYECANLDGASKWKTFTKVTLPMISPVFQVILLLSILNALSINEYVIVLTNGGPYGQTNTVMSYLYTKFVPGFTESAVPQLGYGCSMSLITTIIFAVIAFGYNRFSSKMKNLY